MLSVFIYRGPYAGGVRGGSNEPPFRPGGSPVFIALAWLGSVVAAFTVDLVFEYSERELPIDH